MSFTNNIIDTENLPNTDKINYQYLNKNHLNVMRMSRLVRALLLILILTVLFLLIDEFKLNIYLIILGIIISIFTLRILYCSISFKHKGYALREKDIIYRTGYIWKNITTVPFNRIQHTEIKEGLISRFFSLQTIKFYTAGGSSSDLSIKGLSKNEAENIKEYVNGNLKKYAE